MRSGMNWKHLISAVLLLVLVPVSAFGLSCDVACGLASMSSHPTQGSASKPMDMSQMDCDSMQQEHPAIVAQIPSHCAFTSQSCDEGPCASDSNWVVEQRSSLDLIAHPDLSLSSAIDAAIPQSGASILAPLSSPFSLPPPVYRIVTVLRI